MKVEIVLHHMFSLERLQMDTIPYTRGALEFRNHWATANVNIVVTAFQKYANIALTCRPVQPLSVSVSASHESEWTSQQVDVPPHHLKWQNTESLNPVIQMQPYPRSHTLLCSNQKWDSLLEQSLFLWS